MTGFECKIRTASKELTAKDRVKFKDTSNAISLDEATKNGSIIVSPEMYVILDVHNEKSDDKDYVKYVIVDREGRKFVTGSESFFTAFRDIFDELEEESDPYEIEVFRLPSKNYKGKEFLTCSLI